MGPFSWGRGSGVGGQEPRPAFESMFFERHASERFARDAQMTKRVDPGSAPFGAGVVAGEAAGEGFEVAANGSRGTIRCRTG